MTKGETIAKRLYDILAKDSKNCFDVDISQFEGQVRYEDQGGFIGIDFDELTLTNRGELDCTFCCKTKNEMAEIYVDEDCINLEFYETKSGTKMASITKQYSTLEDLIRGMNEWTLFPEIDLKELIK